MQNIGRMFKGVGELSSTLNTILGLAFVVVLILCIAALIMSWLVVPGLHWRTSSKNKFRKTAVWTAIVLYVFMLLGIMFVMRDPGQGYQLRLLPEAPHYSEPVGTVAAEITHFQTHHQPVKHPQT